MLHLLLAMPTNETLRWILVGLAGVTILYTIFRPSMRRKDPLSRTSPSGSRLSQQRNVERQMESLLVELSEMARQISAQLDTRSAKLETLIHEADEKIAALAALSEAAAGTNGAPMPMAHHEARAPQLESAPIPPPPTIDPRHQEVYELADGGGAAPDIARQLNRPRGEVELILALRPRV